MADFRVQAEPVCSPGRADLTTFPISRKIRSPAHKIRKRLGIPEGKKAVLISMGGIPAQYGFLEKLAVHKEIHFLIPGTGKDLRVQGNVILLPHHSEYYHPDLVNASDAVIGKVGYSTLAEVYHAGVPFGYIGRERFRESQVLISFIESHMKGLAIAENDFDSAGWLSRLRDLLALPRSLPRGPNGAEQVARFILRAASLHSIITTDQNCFLSHCCQK